MKVISLFVLLLSLTSCAPSQSVSPNSSEPSKASNSVQAETVPTPQSQNTNLFIEVKPKTEQPPFEAEFRTGEFAFQINEDGRGKRSDSKGKSRNIDLRFDNGEILERLIYYFIYEDDLLLICETYFNDGGSGFIARLDGSTLKLKWKRHIPAFNVGQGLIHDGFAYVSAIGIVAKVDLKSGGFAWQHSKLYGQDDQAFNSFEPASINGNTVRFTETEHYSRKLLATIDIEIKTGKVVKVER